MARGEIVPHHHDVVLLGARRARMVRDERRRHQRRLLQAEDRGRRPGRVLEGDTEAAALGAGVAEGAVVPLDAVRRGGLAVSRAGRRARQERPPIEYAL
jgi:hypothetical protein